jgi:N utilization substance protein B
MQALYQVDLLGEGDEMGRSLRLFWDHFQHEDQDPQVEVFARELVGGVHENREQIDTLIASSAEHWRLPRLSRVDLNLLRLATYELLCRPEIPSSVTLNEAVEIARRFGSDESAAFVNGVLDHIAHELAAKDPASSSE